MTNPPHNSLSSGAPGLFVTLVAGSDAEAKAGVARALTGHTGGTGSAPVPGEVEADTSDSAEFAMHLAEDLERHADGGRRGNTVVVLDEDADTLEIALILDHVFSAREPSDEPIVLRDLLTVSSVRNIHDLLFNAPDRATGETDFVAPEQLAGRLESATCIVLTDIRAAPPGDGSAVRELLFKLNPAAPVIDAERAGSLLQRPAPVGGGRISRQGARMGWQLELSGRAPASSVHERIGSFVFTDPRPFHPVRLAQTIGAMVPAEVGRVLRSRGLLRLATRPDLVGSWASAGDSLTIAPTTMRSFDPESPLGQEIAFFGDRLDRGKLEQLLCESLLTPAELTAGPAEWATYQDPFPAWETPHHH